MILEVEPFAACFLSIFPGYRSNACFTPSLRPTNTKQRKPKQVASRQAPAARCKPARAAKAYCIFLPTHSHSLHKNSSHYSIQKSASYPLEIFVPILFCFAQLPSRRRKEMKIIFLVSDDFVGRSLLDFCVDFSILFCALCSAKFVRNAIGGSSPSVNLGTKRICFSKTFF